MVVTMISVLETSLSSKLSVSLAMGRLSVAGAGCLKPFIGAARGKLGTKQLSRRGRHDIVSGALPFESECFTTQALTAGQAGLFFVQRFFLRQRFASLFFALGGELVKRGTFVGCAFACLGGIDRVDHGVAGIHGLLPRAARAGRITVGGLAIGFAFVDGPCSASRKPQAECKQTEQGAWTEQAWPPAGTALRQTG